MIDYVVCTLQKLVLEFFAYNFQYNLIFFLLSDNDKW